MANESTIFRNSALVSGLVSPDEIQEAIARMQDQHTDLPTPVVEVTDEQLASTLVDMNVITQYQAEQLLAGRTKLHLGDYFITDWIGQGGMGQVFKAVHKIMGREVAVKVLPVARSTPESIDNFTREIRTQAKLDHPNLVRAYDAGHDGNVHYLVTEYVPGTDLRRYVRAQGSLDMQEAATVVVQAARGLAHAHESGLIHRDVKPGNLLVTPEGVTKVSDLGLAGFMDDREADPRAGKIVGTADYISPEVVKSPANLSHASDIYSLGCTLYYAATGKVPYPGGKTRDKLRRHCEETPWHPQRFNEDISEEFVEVIADMMEKDPEKRMESCDEVIQRLEPWTAATGPSARTLLTSPWMVPPPPAVGDFAQQETVESPQGDYEADSISQVTDPMSSSLEDTKRMRTRSGAPPIPQPDPDPEFSVAARVVLALSIAVPLAMLAGAVLMYVLLEMTG